jgi:hypothetical protein
MSWKRKADVKVAVSDGDAVNARILKLATDLGNTVLAKKAANDLQAYVVYSAVCWLWHADRMTGSRQNGRLASRSLPCFTRLCRFSKHITSVSQHVGLC